MPKVKAAPQVVIPILLSDDLEGVIGKSLEDPHVKKVLAQAGLSIGKKAGKQANPALGVAYTSAKFDIDGKKQLGVDAISFVTGFPKTLPHDLLLGESRAAVVIKLGKPTKTDGDREHWAPSPTRRIVCTFAKKKLVEMHIGR